MLFGQDLNADNILKLRKIELGKKVHSTDLINRGYGTGGVDFLKATENPYGAVITNPPRKIHVFSSRASVAKDGDFTAIPNNGNAIAYAWFVWEKGYKGETVVDWIN